MGIKKDKEKEELCLNYDIKVIFPNKSDNESIPSAHQVYEENLIKYENEIRQLLNFNIEAKLQINNHIEKEEE